MTTTKPTVKTKRKLTAVSTLHYLKLVGRSILLLLAIVLYIINRIKGSNTFFGGIEYNKYFVWAIWGIFIVEMLLRFFPSKLESPGCQKVFKQRFVPTKVEKAKLNSWKSTLAVALAWFALNGVIGILYFTKVIDQGILSIITLAYSVCDMICILFFCPFQTWFMKNRCCVTCRIYNWDFAMMFTPFVFIDNFWARSLLVMSLVLLAVWEITVKVHPERFSETTNGCLSCTNCNEKLCHHKKQLRGFIKKNKDILFIKGNELYTEIKTEIKNRK